MTALLANELAGTGSCLEVGVGTGLVSLPLAAAGVPMVGLDLSAPMLAQAGGEGRWAGAVPAGASGTRPRLPFADDRFGGAVVRHVLHLVPEWRQVVAPSWSASCPGRASCSSRAVEVPVAVARGDRSVQDPGRRAVLRPTGSIHGSPARWMQAFQEHGAAARGACRRSPNGWRRSLGTFLEQMADGLHSWTWEVDEGTRREAAAEVRAWALERFGTLDPPEARDVAIEWRAYDLS